MGAAGGGVCRYCGLGMGCLVGWSSLARVSLGWSRRACAPCCPSFTRHHSSSGSATLDGCRVWSFRCLLAAPDAAWLRSKWAIRGMGGLLVGAVVLLPTWLAMVQLRALGPAALLGIFALVWMADIAAYFSGRAFGKHKLAPTISPGKTWEGAIGAMVGLSSMAWSYARWLVSNSCRCRPGLAPARGHRVSIIGDLFESLLKRKPGSGQQQHPSGHGGVLDRIDSLTSTLPVVALFLLLSQSVA